MGMGTPPAGKRVRTMPYSTSSFPAYGSPIPVRRVRQGDTHVAVDAVDYVPRWEVRDLGVDLDEEGCERVDEVFPLFLR